MTLSLLQTALVQASIELPDEKLEQLNSFLQLINKWNKAYNLTAVRDIEQMIPRHIIDSLTVLPYLSGFGTLEDGQVDVVDIGSGAGLPVIPLAIVHPQLQFLSIESNGKKTRFQQQAKLELGLSNLNVKQERVENVQAQASCVVMGTDLEVGIAKQFSNSSVSYIHLHNAAPGCFNCSVTRS